MKNIHFFIITFLMLATTTLVQAQTSEKAPKDGAVIRLPKYDLEVKAGESISSDLIVLRSKFYAKQQTSILLQAVAPVGFEVSISPNPNTSNEGKMEIKVANDVKPGNYSITLQKANNSNAQVRGLLFNVKVVGAASTISEVKE